MADKRKTIHELRAIAQAKGIKFSFADDGLILAQKITMMDDALTAKVQPPPPRPEYDSRLRTVEVPGQITEEEAREYLAEHIRRGLYLTFPMPERWHMRCTGREDSGSLRMPPRVLMDAADRVMK